MVNKSAIFAGNGRDVWEMRLIVKMEKNWSFRFLPSRQSVHGEKNLPDNDNK